MILKMRKTVSILLLSIILLTGMTVYAAPPKYDTSSFERIDVDCIFSVGTNCRACHNLARNGMRPFAAPLDYIGHPGGVEGFPQYSLATVNHLYETHFKDFFEDAQVIPNKFCGNCRWVRDTKNNIYSIHHFNRNNPMYIEQSNFRKTMIERAKRQEDAFRRANSIGFITNRKNASVNELSAFVTRFSKLYPNKKITLINMVHKEMPGMQQKTIFKNGDLKVVQFTYNEILPKTNEFKNIAEWEGNVFAWKAALSCVHLNKAK